jgi:hypothetical protein
MLDVYVIFLIRNCIFCLFQFYLGENKDDVIEIEESKKEASKLIEATATTIEVETRGQ